MKKPARPAPERFKRTEAPVTCTSMTWRVSEDPALELIYALGASNAEVTNINIKEASGGVEVSFNLVNEDDLHLIRELAQEYGFERRTDGISRFVLYKDRVD